MRKLIITGFTFLFPTIVLAQASLSYVSGTITSIRGIIGIATPVVIGLGLLFFLYGLMKFILAAGNEDAKEQGKRIMIWGIIALFVMVSVWGLVRVLGDNLGVTQGGAPTIPAVP